VSTPIVRRSIGFAPQTTAVEVEIATDADGTVKRLPSRAEFFRALNQVVTERDGEWCGIPVPLPGLGLVLEEKHPHVEQIRELQRITDEHDESLVGRRVCSHDDLEWVSVNSWRGRTRHGVTGRIHVIRRLDGKTSWTIDPDLTRKNRFIWGPFETLDAWTLDAELTAIDRLATLLSERMFKSYVMTGSFLETSKRSGLTYLFRRLRPTVAMSPHGSALRRKFDGEMRILACLCLHPLAYYARTFCGAMVPTDDVIAHLMLMRGDEKLFWKRANQHSALDPEGGL
jgi:hypothetical protein